MAIAFLMLVSVSCYGAEVLNSKEKEQILGYIESIRDKECWEEGRIDLAEKASINNSERIAVIFGYRIGPCQDRNHWQYLAIFKKTPDGKLVVLTKVLANPDTEYFDRLEIQKNQVILSGKAYVPNDRRCCPSGNARIVYELSNGALQKISP